jgi:hypothetical protein
MPDDRYKDNGGPVPKTRPDDARGAPPGGAFAGRNGGTIGNPPFEPTVEQREKVRTLAKTFPVHARHYIARLIGVSVSTLDRHFHDDMEQGRAEMLAAIGAQMIKRAMDAGGAAPAKGELDAQKFILARLGGWSTKVEVAGPGGGALQTVSYDLSALSEDEKRALLPVLDKLIQEQPDGDGGS